MGTIELQTRGDKGEEIIYRNDYNNVKTGVKDNKSYLSIIAGPIEVYLEFETPIDFKNFVNNLKEDFLQSGKGERSPERIIIKVYRNNEELLIGEYSYLEFITKGDKPSFFISTNGKTHKSFEIYFYFDIKEELQKFLNRLETS